MLRFTCFGQVIPIHLFNWLIIFIGGHDRLVQMSGTRLKSSDVIGQPAYTGVLSYRPELK